MSRDPTFSKSDRKFDENELLELENQKIETWLMTIGKGFLYGFIILFINILGVIILNFLGFGNYIALFPLFLVMEAIILLFSSAVVIFFGPSPTYAHFKSKITNTIPRVERSDVSLRKGIIRFIIGMILLFFS